MRELISKITIQPYGENCWQAHVSILDPWLASAEGVMGSHNQDGPWIGGTGRTPALALEALQSALGRLVFAAVVKAPPPIGGDT